ncbi:MAG: hypothetical protein ABI700_08440 [Chloroflexota bacterium]
MVGTLPINILPIYDDMNGGAPTWKTTGSWTLSAAGAYGVGGLGWRATGGAATQLRWNRRIDLRSAPNAYLWVQSTLSGTTPAWVQMSKDGVNWQTISSINPSTAWQVATVNLSAYVGQIIQLQFIWTAPNATNMWKFDDITIGSLKVAAPASGSVQALMVVASPTNTPMPTATPMNTSLPTVASVSSGLPISGLPAYASMDDRAPDWESIGNWSMDMLSAYGGAGLGWKATGGGNAILRWNRQLDLRSTPNAYLWVQSILTGADAPLVQVTTDGLNWTTVGSIPVSTDWQVASIDLSAYAGQMIQLQFTWTSSNPDNFWKIDDVTVGAH